MGLGDVKGASDRDEGVIVSRSLEDVDDGVRFDYVVRPALGGRIAVTDDVGDAVSGTIEGDTEPASLALEDGRLEFELPIEAGVRERVSLVVHDVTVEALAAVEPSVERLATDESATERPAGVFGRLGGLLGGSSDDPESADAEPADERSDDGAADPLDVAALEALSDDVPETPADVIEGADEDGSDPSAAADSASDGDGESPPTDSPTTAESESSATESETPASSESDAESSLERAVESAVEERDGEDPTASPTDESTVDDELAGASTPDEDSTEDSTGADGTTDPAEADGAVDLAVPEAPEPADDNDAERPEPAVPEDDDSVLAELVAELEGEDAPARRAALQEALGVSGRTTEEIETILERQLAIRDAVEDLRTQARETRQTQSTLEEQVEDVDAVVEAIRDEVSTLHRGCSVLEEEVTGFSDRLAALEERIEDVDELREEVERAESQREQLTEGIKAVDDRIDDLGEQKARLQERLDRLESTLQELEAFRQSLSRAFDTGSGGGQGGNRPGGPGGR
jgi:archaellum component FlaC